MKIEISKIPEGGGDYEELLTTEDLDLEGLPEVRFEGPVECRFRVEVVSHELVVRGSLQVRVSLPCSRCACFFSTTAADWSFLRAYDVPEGTETVDLSEDIREDVLLQVPAYPLCSEECRGLCAQCGKNLNEGPCACKPPATGGGGWSALDQLKGL